MTMRDPKFGYCWIWMLPIYYVTETYYRIIRYFTRYKPKHTPELDNLRKLAGIKIMKK